MSVMIEHRFMELLAAYGAELSRWPLEERSAAEELLANGSHRVRDIWESEREFDRLLAIEKDVPASVAIEAEVLASSPGRRRAPVAWASLLKTPRLAGGGAIAAFALGLAAGYIGEPWNVVDTEGSPRLLQVNSTDGGSVFLSAVYEVGG